jgi:ribosome maturation factor RimP
MIDVTRVREIAETQMEGTDLFVVEVRVSPANEIVVTVDSDTQVGIDRCVELSRSIEGALDREQEDFELTVMSAGIGQPLKMLRQYRKLIGRPVEVILKDGGKIVGNLTDASETSIAVEYEERVAVEGKKRKQLVTTRRELSLDEVKSTCEYLDFK